MKKPSKKTINSIKMDTILENIPKDDTNLKYIDMEAGQEHYRLLVWLGEKVDGKILELGTFRGHSALCLSKGGNEVVSCDIKDHLSINENPENVQFIITDKGHELIDHSFSMIFIDTVHDGVYEKHVLDHLRSIEWRGIVVMDDIVLFPELSELWEYIPEKKSDWTNIGHHSGTGLIFFE